MHNHKNSQKILTSSSWVFDLFFVARGTSLVLNKASSLSASVGKSALLAYLTAAHLAIASKNYLYSTTLLILKS